MTKLLLGLSALLCLVDGAEAVRCHHCLEFKDGKCILGPGDCRPKAGESCVTQKIVTFGAGIKNYEKFVTGCVKNCRERRFPVWPNQQAHIRCCKNRDFCNDPNIPFAVPL
ncbi:prostate and testis expressed protein 4-like [Ornithorhynchus anatinus]|uniref:prostate and testis expressed protein 4-like n=1 Tax=Ornithorhynchus anatinus TaxID=9258 RepID=UPI0001555B2E|nr:prostate and testis expressed protein 4-like [Ornithorhynchus anatinus]